MTSLKTSEWPSIDANRPQHHHSHAHIRECVPLDDDDASKYCILEISAYSLGNFQDIDQNGHTTTLIVSCLNRKP